MQAPPTTTMSAEPTTALICFSSRDTESGSQVQLCLGTEGGPGGVPYAFTITIAKTGSPSKTNITERIPLSHADLEKLRGWINLVAPAR